MCGIWFSAGVDAPRAVTDSIAHRGPDGGGWRSFETPTGPAILAHRRLAIIDLGEQAAQPMAYAGGRFWITFNGEIYNYLELREELGQLGHQFETHSDTEVILAAYAQWGEDCLTRFVGMFAFVIYEPERRRVFGARDRFGIKPLYWYRAGTGIAFCSEIKQLTFLPGFTSRLNRARGYDFLMGALSNHTSDTLFRDVQQVRGGECFALNLDDLPKQSTLPVRRWYRVPEPDSLEIGEAEASDRFRELFENSIRLHLRADVTVGSCLSGGLDSSSIVGVMVDQLGRTVSANGVHTISSCFEERNVDERQFIEAVVEKTGVTSSYVFPNWKDLPDLVDKLTWHQDEPFGSTSIYAQWCVFQKAADEGLKVMLDGQGADEQLAGYHGAFGVHMSTLLGHRRIVELGAIMLGRKRHHGQRLLPQLVAVLGNRAPQLLQRLARGKRTAQVADRLLHVEAWREADLTKPPYLAAIERDGLGPLDSIGRLCEALTQTTNLPTLLHFEDRNSMAHSIEARVPFLDHRLVDFNIALGSRHKIVGIETKRVLRRAMADYLPKSVLNRRDKMGFPTPEEIWFRGPLRSVVQDWLELSLATFPGLIDADGVRKLAKDMLDGVRPFDFTMWRFIHFGLWGRRFAVQA
ncbi:MAG TPA: asparagine synthase (glutamine-hydrolyzing) [Kaistia sp.]|nr:asparagine synthase (glutamine-hydrolyzing) [Kaistia sp.]